MLQPEDALPATKTDEMFQNAGETGKPHLPRWRLTKLTPMSFARSTHPYAINLKSILNLLAKNYRSCYNPFKIGTVGRQHVLSGASSNIQKELL